MRMGWGSDGGGDGAEGGHERDERGDADEIGTVENHYEGNDWLKLQIQNSGNFKTDCPIYTFVFGGINYQIEHHLFPSMSNSYYSQIAPTVKEFCKEHRIPYVEHHSLLEVFQQ